MIGRRTFHDATYEFVPANLNQSKWNSYLKEYTNETWEETIADSKKMTGDTTTHEHVISHDDVMEIANKIV